MAGYLESECLIVDFREEKKQAIDAVYFGYYKDIFYLCRKLLGNREDAQDITATCFINLFRKHKDFDSLTNIKAFLYISARNQCFDVLRRRKTIASHQRSLAYALQTSYDQVNDELDIIQLKAIDDSIRMLPPRTREVIELLFLGGKKYKEVAETMNISVQAVTESRQRGLSLLRKMLQHMHPIEMVVLVCLFVF